MKVATFIEPGKMVITDTPKPVLNKRQMLLSKLLEPVFVVQTCGGIVVFQNVKVALLQVMRLLVSLRKLVLK